MAVARETELYMPVKKFFTGRGYEVKAEIRGCDLLAVRSDEPLPTIVEMKKTFTLPLLLQGIDRQKTGAAVWLAVERNRTKKGARNQRYYELTALCRRLGLGFLTVTFYKTKEPAVDVWCEPVPALPAAASRPRKAAVRLLQEFEARSGDFNLGGSTRHKLVTAYRERALQCALALQCHGPSSPRQIREWTGYAKADMMLRDDYYGWFARVQKGVYRLTASGEAALRDYREVVSLLASKLPWAAGWRPEKEERADERAESAR